MEFIESNVNYIRNIISQKKINLVDKNVDELDYSSPLIYCLKIGLFKEAIDLLDLGANPYSQRSYMPFYYPLHYACRHGNIRLFERLIQSPSDLTDLFDCIGYPPIAMIEDIPFLEYVIQKYSVDIFKKNLYVLKYFSEKSPTVCEYIVSKFSEKYLNKIKYSLLYEAIMNNNDRLAVFLYSRGFRIKNCDTLLFAKRNCMNLVKFTLKSVVQNIIIPKIRESKVLYKWELCKSSRDLRKLCYHHGIRNTTKYSNALMRKVLMSKQKGLISKASFNNDCTLSGTEISKLDPIFIYYENGYVFDIRELIYHNSYVCPYTKKKLNKEAILHKFSHLKKIVLDFHLSPENVFDKISQGRLADPIDTLISQVIDSINYSPLTFSEFKNLDQKMILTLAESLNADFFISACELKRIRGEPTTRKKLWRLLCSFIILINKGDQFIVENVIHSTFGVSDIESEDMSMTLSQLTELSESDYTELNYFVHGVTFV
jgi:hypothetical protein